jgi:predicted nicotinamide N-methyase
VCARTYICSSTHRPPLPLNRTSTTRTNTQGGEDSSGSDSDSGFYTQAIPLDSDAAPAPAPPTTPILVHLTLAADDGATPASLFAFSVWNGARLLASHLHRHPKTAQGKATIEFGAAGALPSCAALALGSRFSLLTDYPAPPLLQAMARTLADPRNARCLGLEAGRGRRAAVAGHRWGEDVAPLLAALPPRTQEAEKEEGGGYDLALIGECLWLHREHANLLASVHRCLRVGGQVGEREREREIETKNKGGGRVEELEAGRRQSLSCGMQTTHPTHTYLHTPAHAYAQALVSFSHHVPGCEEEDLRFFQLAETPRVYGDDDGGEEEGWFVVERVGEWPMPHAHAQGRTAPQFLYRLTKRRGAKKETR